MTQVSTILASLDLGNSVAESDLNLQEYFLETQQYRDLIAGRRDVIGGDKGAGKTALYKILQSNYKLLPELHDVEVIPAFNPVGSPVFQELTDRAPLSEVEYVKLWKAYILATVGNWLLNTFGSNRNKQFILLDNLLDGLELRTPNHQTRAVFKKITDSIGSLFHWKKAEIEFGIDAAGKYTITPRLESAGQSEKANDSKNTIPVEAALQVLDDCLVDVKRTVWVALDRLDEAFQGMPSVEIPALRALLKTYLDVREFKNFRIKLFLRKDLFRRIVDDAQFVNLTHINSSKTDLFWNDDDLRNLLLKRVKKSREFMEFLPRNLNDNDLFNVIFPDQVDQGSRKPKTWVWVMRRVRDGNNIKPPRNLIDLVLLARDEQLKKEDREPREWTPEEPLIEPEALKLALTQLSENRVQDTLLAEAGQYASLVKKFENSWAEHNEESLSSTLEFNKQNIKGKIKPLVDLRFLEYIRATGTYKIPALYRSGLSITQGKAFISQGDGDDDDE